MSFKLIYFVRHGETVLNAQGIRQGSGGPLTDQGRAQALATAKRFPKHRGKADIIIASPYERTRETAHIIAEELDLPIEYCDLLVERRNPSEIIGKSGSDPMVKEVIDRIDKSFHEDNLRFSDEENFIDLKERARKLLIYISERPEKKLIMVTHGIFLKMVAAYMMYGESLDASLYNKLSFYNPMDNAGMTICSYKSHWFSPNEWRILVWNDLTEKIEERE